MSMSDERPVDFDQIMKDAPKEKDALDAYLMQTKRHINDKIIPLSDLGYEWIKKPLDPRPALLTDSEGQLVIPRGKVGMLIGAGGTGKTRLLLQMCYCIASEKPFLGCLTPKDIEGKILYFFGEEDLSEIRRRLQETYHSLRLPDKVLKKIVDTIHVAPLHGLCANFMAKQTDSPVEYQIEAFLDKQAQKGITYAAIIMDPISRFLPQDGETDNTKATQFIAICERFTNKKYGNPTVLLSHHVNKNSLGGVKLFSEEDDKHQGASRGASGLVDGSRFVVSVDTVKQEDWMENTTFSDRKIIKTKLVKANNGPYIEPILSYFDDNGVIQPLSEDDILELKRVSTITSSPDTSTLQEIFNSSQYSMSIPFQSTTEEDDEEEEYELS